MLPLGADGGSVVGFDALDSGDCGSRCEVYNFVHVSMTGNMLAGGMSANVTLWLGEKVIT